MAISCCRAAAPLSRRATEAQFVRCYKSVRSIMISDRQIENLMVIADGLPRPQWDDLDRLVEALPESEQDAAWDSVLRTWLATLATALSDSATVFAGNGLLLLASCSDDQGEQLHSFGVRTVSRIRTLLKGLPPVDEAWTPVVLVFADVEQFYDYISFFHAQEGEYGAVGGMFVSSVGYPHVVVGPGEPWMRHATIAHELTHDYLFGRELPLWLEEGLTQTVEETALGAPLFVLDRELRDRHRRFWSSHGLDQFWSGEAFRMPSDFQEFSYQLALVLLRAICSHHAKHVGDFVGQAKWQDAGESAAVSVLGDRLSRFASDFLGEGAWSPRDYSQIEPD